MTTGGHRLIMLTAAASAAFAVATACGVTWRQVLEMAGVQSGPRATDLEIPARARAAAPSFELPDTDGKYVRLSDYKGKLILIEIGHPTCPGCREAMPHLVGLQKKYADKGLTVLYIVAGIYPTAGYPGLADSVIRDADNFAREFHPPFKILIDPEPGTYNAFQCKGWATLVLVGTDGRMILNQQVSPFPDDKIDVEIQRFLPSES